MLGGAPYTLVVPPLAEMMRGRDGVVLDGVLASVLGLGAGWTGGPRGVQVLVLLALLATLGRVGWRAASGLLPDVRGASRGICAATVGLGAPTLLGTVLGHFGLLRPGFFLGGMALLLLLGALVARRRGDPPSPPEPAAPDAEPSSPAWLRVVERTLLVSVLLLLALLLLRSLRDNRYSPVGTFGFDDPSYHLSAVAVWQRSGDLRMLKFAYGDASPAFYPIGAELFAWSLLAPFGDSDFAMRWAQLPFLLGSLLAVYGIARALGVTRSGAWLAVALFWAVRELVPVTALSAGNDLSACFFTLAGVDALLLLGRRASLGRAVYAGLALGLLVGTKYIGLLFLGPLFALLLASLWAHRGAWRGRRVAVALGVVVATALLAGGYTYARNAWVTGNPVFPAPVAVAGVEVFAGWPDVSLDVRRHLPDFAIDVSHFLTRRTDLYGRAFPFTLLPAALLAPFAALLLPRRRPLRARLETAAALALPAVFFLQFLYQMHDHRTIRYFLGGIALAAVACAWLVDRTPPSVAAALSSLIAAALFPQLLSATALGATERTVWVAGLLAIGIAADKLARRRAGAGWRHLATRWAAPAAAMVAAVAALRLGAVVERYQADKLWQAPPAHATERRAAAALERLAGPAGTEVAYLGMNRPYHFFGSRLQNRVDLVPSERDLEGRFFDWDGHARWPYSGIRFWVWRENLERLGIDYVVVVLSPQVNPERRWLRRHPGLYRRVYRDGWTEIWEVRR